MILLGRQCNIVSGSVNRTSVLQVEQLRVSPGPSCTRPTPQSASAYPQRMEKRTTRSPMLRLVSDPTSITLPIFSWPRIQSPSSADSRRGDGDRSRIAQAVILMMTSRRCLISESRTLLLTRRSHCSVPAKCAHIKVKTLLQIARNVVLAPGVASFVSRRSEAGTFLE
jgi:hypothetical protein